MTTIPLPSPKNGVRLVIDHKTGTLNIIRPTSRTLANDQEPGEEQSPSPVDSLRELLTGKLQSEDLDTAMQLINAIAGITTDEESVAFEDSRRTNPLNDRIDTGRPHAATRDQPAMDSRVKAAQARMRATQKTHDAMVKKFPALAGARVL